MQPQQSRETPFREPQQMYENYENPRYTEGYAIENNYSQRDQPNDRFSQENRFGENLSHKVYPPDSQAHLRITAKQRMTVAIVSVSVLLPLTAVILTSNVSDQTAGNPFIIISRLITLALVCLTMMVINLAMGWKR